MKENNELMSLNMSNLDIDELESRLELVTITPDDVCGPDGSCGVNCYINC
jgi:hypothetical protein